MADGIGLCAVAVQSIALAAPMQARSGQLLAQSELSNTATLAILDISTLCDRAHKIEKKINNL